MFSQKLSIVTILTPFCINAFTIFLCDLWASEISVAHSNKEPRGWREDMNVSVEGL